MKKKILCCLVAVLLLSSFVFLGRADGIDNNYPHVKNGKIDQTGYFILEGAEIFLEEEAIGFRMTANTAKITFDKPLVAEGFSLKWNVADDSQKRLEKAVLTLTDIENADCAVCVNYQRINESFTSVKLNDENMAYLTKGSLYKANERDFTIAYNSETSTMTDEDSVEIPVSRCVNGDSFTGFNGLAVNMTLELTGKPGAVVYLKSLNMQRLGAAYETDNVEPLLCLPKFSKKVLYNSVFELPQVAAYDVLATDVSMELTVKDPTGEVMKDTEGNLLEGVDGRNTYKIKLEQYGSYQVNYVLSDGTNKTLPMGYRLDVADDGAPTVTLSEPIKALTVGKDYRFPTVTVADNSEAECKLWISVKHPNGTISSETESFVPEEAGVYYISFTAMDENGNICRHEVKTYAKEE